MTARASKRLVKAAVRVWLAFVLAAVTSSSTLAWAAPCCAHEGSSHEDAASEAPAKADGCCPNEEPASDDHAPEDPCSCPLDCGPCCAGTPAPALPDIAVVQPTFLPDFYDLNFLPAPLLATTPPPDDVLHVPKPSALDR